MNRLTKTYQRYGKSFNAAIKFVFAKDARKVAVQTLKNAPVLRIDLSSKQLGVLARREGNKVAAAAGFNDWDKGSYGVIYIASEYARSGSQNAIFGTYAHELANVLDARLNRSQITYGNRNDPDDDDTGAAVEKRMFGALQYP